MLYPDPDRVAAYIRETAALDVWPRYQALAAHEVMEKAPGDVVTVADHDAEARLTKMLRGLAQGALIVGEEAVHEDKSLLDKLDTQDAVWLIDPVDGTANFAAGKPTFMMMIAYIVGGHTRAGWIYSPANDEMSVAALGDGAALNGALLRLQAPDGISGLRGRINYGVFDEDRRPALRERIRQTFNIEKSAGCAGYEFVSLAKGESDFRMYRRLWAWDHAPGVLIHSEAGGYCGRIDGAPYKPTERTFGLFCAPNEDSWHEINAFMEA